MARALLKHSFSRRRPWISSSSTPIRTASMRAGLRRGPMGSGGCGGDDEHVPASSYFVLRAIVRGLLDALEGVAPSVRRQKSFHRSAIAAELGWDSVQPSRTPSYFPYSVSL